MIGVVIPPTRVRHRTLASAAVELRTILSGRSRSGETPFCRGPRQNDQFSLLVVALSAAGLSPGAGLPAGAGFGGVSLAARGSVAGDPVQPSTARRERSANASPFREIIVRTSW